MITGAIALFILIAVLPPAISNGQTGTMWIAIIIAVLLLLFGAASRASDRAYMNRINYWAMDGKDRAKARHRWEAEARQEEAIEAERRRQKQQKRNDRDVEKAIQRIRKEQEGRVGTGKNRSEVISCSECGAEAYELSRVEYPKAKYIQYRCPACGNKGTKKIT